MHLKREEEKDWPQHHDHYGQDERTPEGLKHFHQMRILKNLAVVELLEEAADQRRHPYAPKATDIAEMSNK